MDAEKILQKVESYIIYGLIFILPFTVLSISSNPFTVSKLAILIFFLLLLVIVMAIRSIINGKLAVAGSAYDVPVVIIAISYIASLIFRTPNKMEGLLLPGTTTAVVGGALLYFVINQLKDKSVAIKILVYSGMVYALLTIMAYTGLLGKIPQLPAFMKAKSFSPEGGYLPSFIYLVTILPLAVSVTLSDKDLKMKLLSVFSTFVILAGLILSIYQIFPGRVTAPRFPNIQTSWEISIDSLKTSPLLGVGPGNYMSAFNRFRPIAFNSTDIWAVKYSTASNYYFTLFTETGLLGLAGMILLLWVFFKDAKKQLKEHKLVNWGFTAAAPILSFALLAIILAIYPATIFINILLFILLAFAAKSHPGNINLTIQRVKENGEASPTKLMAVLIATPVIALALYVGYLGFGILKGEYYYKSALEALLANDAQGTFNFMGKAVAANPRVDRYRATSSRIYLILADATARKKDITETDRTTITQLVQAAIAEGKANVALNPLRAQNWEVLGRTYQTIIPLANGADGFAAQAYSQAIALDPTNPQTRITLGGLYYSAKNYETASRVFELAVTSKPDLANGHFNLGYSYNEQGKLDAAIQQMSLVLGMVQPDSKDYEAAKKALEAFQAKKKAATPATGTENLTTPPAVPTPAIQPKVELPEGSEPPAAPVTETPTPTTSPAPAQ